MSIVLNPGEQRQLNVQLTPLPVQAATLYGSVTDAINPGISIQGAVVQITGPGGTYQAITDATGLYQITNIVPGTYGGMVTHPDYQTAYF